jgi:hypothetical protein
MGEEWTIEALPAGAGVDLRLVLPIDGKPVTVVLSLDRAQARAFGRSVLAAAGDALGQTFPAPVLPPPTRTDV